MQLPIVTRKRYEEMALYLYARNKGYFYAGIIFACVIIFIGSELLVTFMERT